MKTCNRIAVLAIFVAGWPASAALAQQKEEAISSLEEIKNFYGKSIEDLIKLWPTVANRRDADLNENDKKIFDTAAKYYVFRVTWPEYVDDREKMGKAVDGFAKLYTVATNLRNNLYFHDQLAVNFKQVFAREFLKNRLSSQNAALMLPGLGKSKSPALSDLLTDLVRDEKQQHHDAVKIHAIKALADYFPLENNPKDAVREQKRVDALARYIERTWPGSMKGEVVFYLRREAIRSLARAQAPTVALAANEVKGQAAIALLKVLAREKLSPPPAPLLDPLELMGLEEKCYAALGLCDMKPSNKYQPDLSVYAVGHCLVDFFDAYQRDQPNLVNLIKGGKAVIDKSGERKVVLFPWKLLADRWTDSLQNLVRYTDKHLEANTQAKAILDMTRGSLSAVSKYGVIDAQPVTNLRQFMSDKAQKPARNKLFTDSVAPEVILGY